MKTVIVYYTPGCLHAARLKARLTLNRIPFRSIPFPDAPGIAGEVRTTTHPDGIAPAALVGSRLLSNPSITDIQQIYRSA